VEESPGAIDWRDQVQNDVLAVLEAARSLGVGGAYPDCASAGYRAILSHDTTASGAWRFAAALGHQSTLAATGQVGELTTFLDTVSIFRSNLRPLLIVDALAGIPVDLQAEQEAERLRSDPAALRDWEIWYLGIWDAHRDRLEEARELQRKLAEPSLRRDPRRADLISESLLAHLALAESDTVRAVRLLDDLAPNVRRGSLIYPWESLGVERLLHARLLLAQGLYAEAYREAGTFDSPGAANILFPVFLPASLQIRLMAARELGDQGAVERMNSRLRALGR
jgi:hypothetical protein